MIESLVNSALSQQQMLQSMELQTSVLKKTMDSQKTIAGAILTLIDGAMPAGKAVGLGQRFDVSG